MLDKVRTNGVISRGVEIYNIAKEVYNVVNSDKGNQDSAEDIYMTAVETITKDSPEAIDKRIDFRAVKATATNLRALRSRAGKYKARAQQKISELRKRAIEILKWGFAELKSIYIRFRVIIFQSKVCNSKRIRPLVAKLRELKTRLPDIQNKIDRKQFDNLNVDILKDKSLKALQTLKLMIKSSIGYFLSTVAQNDESIKEMASYSYQSARKGISANWSLFVKTLKTNEELLLKYLNDIELEFYYGPGKSIKLADIIREYIEDITLDVREQESIIIESDGNGEYINLIKTDDDVNIEKLENDIEELPEVQENISLENVGDKETSRPGTDNKFAEQAEVSPDFNAINTENNTSEPGIDHTSH